MPCTLVLMSIVIRVRFSRSTSLAMVVLTDRLGVMLTVLTVSDFLSASTHRRCGQTSVAGDMELWPELKLSGQPKYLQECSTCLLSWDHKPQHARVGVGIKDWGS